MNLTINPEKYKDSLCSVNITINNEMKKPLLEVITKDFRCSRTHIEILVKFNLVDLNRLYICVTLNTKINNKEVVTDQWV